MTPATGTPQPQSTPSRTATVRWRTPGPTSVDEELAVYDDGTAVLAVRVPRDGGATIGTFTGRPAAAVLTELAAVGTVEVDLLAPGWPAGGEIGDVLSTELRGTPTASVTFSAAARPGAPGTVELGLYAVATGTAALAFELDATRCAVHFLDQGRLVGWVDVPDLPTGFVTPDAIGLGGVGRPAAIGPGGYGAIAFAVPMTVTADEVQVQAAGRILLDLPDGAPTAFEVRTAPAPVSAART